jgi:hypothetical protein
MQVHPMTPEEFKTQTRDVLELSLNQLQSATLMIAQLESQVADVGRSVRTLSQLIETFVTQEPTQPDSNPRS